jgi:hypothetical protein
MAFSLLLRDAASNLLLRDAASLLNLRQGGGAEGWEGMTAADRLVYVRSTNDVDGARDGLIFDVFLASLPSEVGTLENVASPLPGLTGVATCQKIVFSTWGSRPRVFTPTISNNEVVIVHQGHGGGYSDLDMDDVIQTFITAGFVVVGMVMPGGDEVTSGDVASHGALTLSDFLGPVIGAINTLDAGPYDTFYMTGLSGGGWTTHLAAALDVRIAKSYPIAGSLPLDMTASRDNEQLLPDLNITDYLDIYALGATPDRRVKHILYTEDLVFDEAVYATGEDYAPMMTAAATAFGGEYDLVWIDSSVHAFSVTVVEDEILPELLSGGSSSNCGLLLNDSSFILLNAGGVLLLNDASCSAEAGVSESVLGVTGSWLFEGVSRVVTPDAVTPEVPSTGVGSVAWAEHQKTLRRREQWEADNKRMELLERKKTRISLDVGWLRDELRQAKEAMRPPRMLSRLQFKLDTAMSDLMAVEDELQQIYIRMMS